MLVQGLTTTCTQVVSVRFLKFTVMLQKAGAPRSPLWRRAHEGGSPPDNPTPTAHKRHRRIHHRIPRRQKTGELRMQAPETGPQHSSRSPVLGPSSPTRGPYYPPRDRTGPPRRHLQDSPGCCWISERDDKQKTSRLKNPNVQVIFSLIYPPDLCSHKNFLLNHL